MDDTEDLERGYYVYLHRDRATRTPFYVGKGKGRRAYDVEGRPLDWHKKVKSLTAGFDTEIVKNDLSEEDAYDLERELIRKYGKIADGKGTLLNVTDGGSLDFGEASVEFGMILSPKLADAFREDYESRSYRKLRPEERKSFSESLIKRIGQFRTRYNKTVVEDQETDFELDVDNLLWGVANLAEKYAKRKVSSKDFGYELEELYEDTESHLEDAKGEKPEMVAIVKECRAFLEEKVNDLKGRGAEPC
jgi:hypothetical protein